MLNLIYRMMYSMGGKIMIPILDSKRQYAQIGAEVEKAVCEVLRSGSYILGPNCKALESELAKYTNIGASS